MRSAPTGGPGPRADRPPDLDESALVRGLIAQDPDAVAKFLERTHHAVYAFACRLNARTDLRRDWTHDTLLGLIGDMAAGRFVYRGAGSFWAWFRKRAYFRLLDEYRRHRLRADRERQAGGDEGGVDLEDFAGTQDVEAEVERAEILSAIESCLEKLPSATQRRALRSAVLEGMEYQEIADAMTTPINTVRAWIRRGRLAVRKCLIAALGLSGRTREEENDDD